MTSRQLGRTHPPPPDPHPTSTFSQPAAFLAGQLDLPGVFKNFPVSNTYLPLGLKGFPVSHRRRYLAPVSQVHSVHCPGGVLPHALCDSPKTCLPTLGFSAGITSGSAALNSRSVCVLPSRSIGISQRIPSIRQIGGWNFQHCVLAFPFRQPQSCPPTPVAALRVRAHPGPHRAAAEGQ